MKIGVHVANARPWATPECIVSLGTQAEALGYDSLWVSDQVVIPSELRSSFPFSPTGQYDIDGARSVAHRAQLCGLKPGTGGIEGPLSTPTVIRSAGWCDCLQNNTNRDDSNDPAAHSV